MTFSDAAGGTAETADSPRRVGADGVITPDARGHVREHNTSTSGDTGMSDCGSADDTAEPSADTDSNRSRGFAGRFLARFGPPDIWGDRPGLAKLYAYAYRGEGAPAEGPLRTGQIWWYRLVALPITAKAYWQAWMVERPFRGALVLAAQIVWWVLNIVTLAHLL